MKNKVDEIIIKVVSNKLNHSKIEIYDDAHLKNDLGLDSLELAELTVYIEDEFGIDIFEDGVVKTVKEIYNKLNIK
jgi:acyl carrier protein